MATWLLRIPFLFMVTVFALSPAIAGEQQGQAAIVTMVEGKAQAYAPGATKGTVLRKGDQLTKDQEIRVAEKSRIELRFPDGTVMRLAEKSTLQLSDVAYDRTSGMKRVKVNLSLGKLWANVKKLVTPDSSVEVKTLNAVAGVRGTVYRVNVEEDAGTLVKVYDGSVAVSGKPVEVPKPAAPVSGPVPVQGPHEVQAPYHEVTMEEWTVIVQAMQQIQVSPGGVASQPRNFTPQEDADDWVRWNRERDKQIAF